MQLEASGFAENSGDDSQTFAPNSIKLTHRARSLLQLCAKANHVERCNSYSH
jgi:hypothetical protein